MDEGPADQTDAVDKDGRAGSVSCEISMQSRLPTPQVWAPQGGRCPRTLITITTFNPIIIEEQPENTAEEDTTTKEAKKTSQEEGVWVKGADQEENERYAGFLNYLEERRQEMKALLERDEERIEMAKKKSSTWELMRESVSILKAKDGEWKSRRIEECMKIKEEDRKDRLAVANMKRKRYGIKKLSKEENQRLKRRTEERL